MRITKQKDGTLLVPDSPTIPFITGDGVGAEITPAMQEIVNAAVQLAYGSSRHIEWKEVFAGQRAFDATGSWLPDDTMKAFQEYLIGIKGPLTTPVGGGIRSLNVALRQTLDLYVCLRPVRWFRGVESPIKEPQKVNMHIFRENTEDIYAGIEWEAGSPEAKKFYRFLHDEMGVTKVRFPETSGFGVKPVSKEGTERLVRAACRYAIEFGLPTVTLVHKGNIMKYTEGGFKKWGYELAQREFAEPLADGRLLVNDCIADAFLQNTLLRPEDYSVVATLNLNGDYISDQLAAMVGGIGIAPGANINYISGHAIFEATHGTAPDIAGADKANPCSLLLSAVMMLEYMGWQEPADLIVDALEQSFAHRRATHDLARFMPNGHSLGTAAFAQEIIKRIND
ncbi:NADP-dependent isocitrate dehydrogenase [Bacteroides sp.]|uniref:NADP-dependent isocitrate dehydrogenase n=1 Tax=Bacteroides sp. TaxID=29523 RepID=UPI001B58C1FB|nr:NADP-dependent isocitrate dehydrogenase [Bacteroides sp.]MBP6064841.1 NADP-dependent isocitrate dehydrogenase [Bacteroides sp.]MBP6067093.1 NADP-dependent isocitrate dehydrogenase [Bacteroides sp.]MBP6935999.1 NADP-dependent isocitrate dehydrogenase [Bacteroides sp.]MBP8621234.1 NADP-dependent isocitrate dehydrogenase [Bacteroides sp.]MBP9506327.1 NADP-dependent isocitrate dehydrogenase [Bacteroides sp.]